VVTGGDSGDSFVFEEIFLSPPREEVVTGGDSGKMTRTADLPAQFA
jgi:hypothetical protein